MAVTLGPDVRSTLFGWSQTLPGSADAFNSNLTVTTSPVTSAPALGPYAIAIAGRKYAVDTSFEPYRREAFRHRTIPAQRQSINLTNIAGEGTVNSEGLWRREQVDWSMGAGQQFLDRKGDSADTRFYQSKGLDVFSAPYQFTLLPDVKKAYSSTNSNILLSRCGPYSFFVDGNVVKSTPDWNSTPTTCTFSTFTPPSNLIVGASYLNGVFTYTTNTPHNYSVGYNITVSGVSPTIFNRSGSIATVPNSTTFTINATIATNITAISSTSTTWTFTAPSNAVVVGETVAIAGCTSNTYNGTWTVATASSSQFTVTQGGNPGAGTVLGTYLPVFASNGSVACTTTFGTPSTISAIDTNETYVFLATNTGIWYGPGSGTAFSLYAAPDVATGFTGGFDLVRSCNDQIIASRYNNLYAMAGRNNAFGAAPTLAETLYTHSNPSWIWSDAVGGATQVYFAGYTKSGTSGYSGCIYRSDLQGSTTTTTSGVTSVTNSSVIQPFVLNTPVQALPMSPDEYPTCLQSYLNFVFVGTNKGIRMCQTLSIYDPSATATGDLKSGPLIPNILQPFTPANQPKGVTGIVGDGRFIWFTWSNYDSISTGLGKLDLSTFINGDPLAPAYASDLMAGTTTAPIQGVVTSLDWNPITQNPMFAVAGSGIYTQASTYVPVGTLNSGIYTYGIPDPKNPVFFDYNCVVPSGTDVQAALNIDEHDPDFQGSIVLPKVSQNSSSELSIPSGYSGENLSTTLTVYSNSPTYTGDTGAYNKTPIVYRWTTKVWPAVASEITISPVIQLYSVNRIDGEEMFTDPYFELTFLDNLRRNQTITTYQEGNITVPVIVDALDWLPHKRRDNYENGFEGDCVVYLKTVGRYVYNEIPTI